MKVFTEMYTLNNLWFIFQFGRTALESVMMWNLWFIFQFGRTALESVMIWNLWFIFIITLSRAVLPYWNINQRFHIITLSRAVLPNWNINQRFHIITFSRAVCLHSPFILIIKLCLCVCWKAIGWPFCINWKP
jgi:hypothetical protein